MTEQPGKATYAEIRAQDESMRAVAANMEEILSVFAGVLSSVAPQDIIFTGCGTSYHLAQTASALFSRYNRTLARAVPSSELYLYPGLHFRDQRTLVVPITRLSTTTEVRAALAEAHKHVQVSTMAISCDERSRELNDFCALSPNAAEDSIVMTRSYSSMLYMSLLFALAAGDRMEAIERSKVLPDRCARLMDRCDRYAETIAAENEQAELFIYLGQGPYYGVACEAMIKMKEMSLAHSEAYHSMEYRHGPISLADSRTLVTLFSSGAALEAEAKLLGELKQAGARTFFISDTIPASIKEEADYWLELDSTLDDYERVPLTIIPGQLTAYHVARYKGLDLDAPRNLAKAIVLE